MVLSSLTSNRKTKMRWSENETYQFVKIYLSHEYLWNPGNLSYRIKNKRLKAFRDIVEEFQSVTGIALNETEVKIKIKNLRSTYSQELGKIKNRSRPDWSYTPNMKWFGEWHKAFSTLKKPSEDISFDEHQETSDDPCSKIWLENDDTHTDPFPDTDEDYKFIFKSEPEHITKNHHKNKKKKIKQRSPSTDCSDGTFRGSMDSTESITKEDEFDIYGKYIASQLRKMDLQKALRLQLEIQTLVSEARISGIDN